MGQTDKWTDCSTGWCPPTLIQLSWLECYKADSAMVEWPGSRWGSSRVSSYWSRGQNTDRKCRAVHRQAEHGTGAREDPARTDLRLQTHTRVTVICLTSTASSPPPANCHFLQTRNSHQRIPVSGHVHTYTSTSPSARVWENMKSKVYLCEAFTQRRCSAWVQVACDSYLCESNLHESCF